MTKARDLANFISGTDSKINNAELENSSITINGSAVALGGSVTVGETKPTFSSVTPSTIENTQTYSYYCWRKLCFCTISYSN